MLFRSEKGKDGKAAMLTKSTRNYELDKLVRHVKNHQGGVERLSAAVVIKERPAGAASKDGSAAPAGYSPEEVERLHKLHFQLTDFILHLIQAFLRTGYYTPDHPEWKRAQEGLYQKFKQLFEHEEELTFLVREEQELARDALALQRGHPGIDLSCRFPSLGARRLCWANYGGWTQPGELPQLL